MTTEKTEKTEKSNEEKINEFMTKMVIGGDIVVTSYKNMLVGAEEALAVLEDPEVQGAIATIASRCFLAYERIKEKTDQNIDELKARRPEFYKTEEKTEEEE
jgi:hypothetical protein